MFFIHSHNKKKYQQISRTQFIFYIFLVMDPESLLTSPAFVEVLRALGLTTVDADAFQMLVCFFVLYLPILLFFFNF